MKDKPDLNIFYLCFSADHDLQAAVAEFTQRYGQQPEQQPIKCNGLWWIGPLPKKQESAPA